MLGRILSMIPEGNRRFPLRFKRMTSSISDRMWLARNRYLLAHPIHTPGMELLRFICLNLDMNALDDYRNDVDRYTEIIKYTGTSVRAVVDPMFTNNINGGRWIAKSPTQTPNEIILNCECANAIKELPFDRDWTAWQSLRGVRLLYHDSLELPEDFASSMLQFKAQRPNYLMLTLNVPVLCFKYYKYYTDCKKDHIPPDVDDFLKNFEYSAFFDDLLNIWILNFLLRIMSDPDRQTGDIIKDITMPIRFCTTNMLQQGIDGVKEFVELLRSGSMKPQDFLVTRWFGDMNLLDLINENCYRWVQLPQTYRYLWMKTLNQFPYFCLLMEAVRQFPDTPFKDTINLRCNEVWRYQIQPISMPSAVTSPTLGDFIRKWQNTLGHFLNGDQVVFPVP